MSGYRHPFPFGDDPGMAAQAHLSKSLDEHRASRPVPIKNLILSRALRTTVRLLNSYAADAHRLREVDAAKCLETAEEAVMEARARLEGKVQ